MIRLLGVLYVLLAIVGCSESQQETNITTAEEQPANVSETAFNAGGAPIVVFSVPNMMCEDSCVPTVRETLAAQAGVKDVKVELATKTATVAVDTDAFDAQKAIAALVDLQFKDTTLASADGKTAEGEAAHN